MSVRCNGSRLRTAPSCHRCVVISGVGAPSQHLCHDFGLDLTGSEHQRCLTLSIAEIGVGARGQQELGDGGLTCCRGDHERAIAIVVCHVDVDARSNEQAQRRDLAAQCRINDCRLAVARGTAATIG